MVTAKKVSCWECFCNPVGLQDKGSNGSGIFVEYNQLDLFWWKAPLLGIPVCQNQAIAQKRGDFKNKVVLIFMFSVCLPGDAPPGMGVRSLGNLPRLQIAGVLIPAGFVPADFQAAL